MIHNGQWLWDSSKPPIVGMLNQKMTAHGTSYGLSEAGYDIRIKQDILFKRMKPHRKNKYKMHVTVDGQSFVRGRFTLASAIEEFDMPENLVAVVHDKSTWARMGLSVFNTVIEPGWKGFLTLELVYHGRGELHIPAGSGIAQVLFHRISNQASYEGKYQNQEDKPIESKWVNDSSNSCGGE